MFGNKEFNVLNSPVHDIDPTLTSLDPKVPDIEARLFGFLFPVEYGKPFTDTSFSFPDKLQVLKWRFAQILVLFQSIGKCLLGSAQIRHIDIIKDGVIFMEPLPQFLRLGNAQLGQFARGLAGHCPGSIVLGLAVTGQVQLDCSSAHWHYREYSINGINRFIIIKSIIQQVEVDFP